MSDIMIPGITNSGLNTDGMVEDIMEAERAPVTRMEDRIDSYEEEREAWLEIGRRASNLQEAARLLFGFENPFNERIASSTNEGVLVASAEHAAPEGTSRIAVHQLAEADRFFSRSLPSDFQVAAGRYGFRVGEEEEYFAFSGGSLESFAEAINRRAGDVVGARVVRNTADSKTILIEANRTGAENQPSFLEDARSFALEAGVLEEVRDQVVQAPIQASTVDGTTASSTRTVQAGTLTVEPEGQATVRLPAPVTDTESLVMELEVDVRNLSEEWTAPEPPPGPEIPDTGSITLGDVTIENAPSEVPLPGWEPPEPPEVREDPSILFLSSSGRRIELPALADTEGFETVRVPLSQFADRLDAIEVRNNNTHRRVRVRNITIYDPRTRGDVAPLNPVSTARDAIVEIEGIEVIRPTNAIDDLIDGVTLNLRGTSSVPVDVTVEPDREAVTDSLIQFVFYYNELVRHINILTRSEEAIVDELTNLNDDERQEALEDLGLLQGNLSLNSLKSRLQTIMMNAYPTDAGTALAMLAQMGISTNESGPGSGVNSSRLRGYMEMNPADVETVLQTRFASARQLFGSDSNGDRAVDTGVAYEIDRNLRPYVQTDGLIPQRTGNIEQSISDTQNRIERENARLEEVEARYRAEFAQMEAAMQEMKENQRALQNLQTQSGGQQ
ncbi:MAG: flagellar filament capping protein FliD [Spirochaetota bacterium]